MQDQINFLMLYVVNAVDKVNTKIDYCHGNSMNNLLSYCGLVDARISASEKDLPVIFR